MFRAGLHPRHSIAELAPVQRRALHDAIIKTVREAIAKGGRADELDLFGQPGRYDRIMSRETLGKPYPRCGAKIEKIAFLGGTCYLCPKCQS